MNCMKIIAFTLFAFAAISFTHAVQNSDEEKEEEIAQNDPFDEESEEEGGDIDRWEEEAEDEMANADETHLEDDPTPFVGPTGPMPMFHPYPPNLTPDSRCPGSVGARLYPDQAAEMRATFHHIINIVSDQHLLDIHRALRQVRGVRLLLDPSNSSVGGRQPFTVIPRGGAPFIFPKCIPQQAPLFLHQYHYRTSGGAFVPQTPSSHSTSGGTSGGASASSGASGGASAGQLFIATASGGGSAGQASSCTSASGGTSGGQMFLGTASPCTSGDTLSYGTTLPVPAGPPQALASSPPEDTPENPSKKEGDIVIRRHKNKKPSSLTSHPYKEIFWKSK